MSRWNSIKGGIELVRAYRDGNYWCIDRGNGEKVRFNWQEYAVLFTEMLRENLWESVATRYGDDPKWEKIEQAKDKILNCLVYEDDTALSDMIANAIEYCVRD